MKRVNGFLVEFNNFENYEMDEIYITIAIKGGIVGRMYQNSETGDKKEMNQAAGRVYLKHLSDLCKGRVRAEFAAGKNGSYVTIRSGREKIVETLRKLFALVYIENTTEEAFAVAKEEAITDLKKAFKNQAQRMWYYMFEFSEVGKRYAYNRLAEDLYTMKFEELEEYKRHMVNTRNSVVIVSGRLDEVIIRDICIELENVKNVGEEYLTCGYDVGVNQVIDRHLIMTGNADALGSLYFVFPEQQGDLAERMVLLQYISEILFEGKASVSVDAFDASIVYYGKSIDQYEMQLRDIWTTENVKRAKKHLLEQYESLMSTPEIMGVYVGEQILGGIDFFKVYQYIQICNADDLEQTYRKADVKVANGAVISVKEGKDGGRTSD